VPRRALQLVGHDHPQCVLQTLQKSPKEALGRMAIAPILDKNFEDNATLIDGTQGWCCAPWIWMNTSSMCHLVSRQRRRKG